MPVERRLTTRHRARTTVYVLLPGPRRRLCRASNLSASGVFVETGNLGLRRGQTVELAFAISLGTVTKIHRRTAVATAAEPAVAAAVRAVAETRVAAPIR